MKTASVARLTHESSLQAFLLRKQVLREAKCILVPRARRFLVRWSGNKSGNEGLPLVGYKLSRVAQGTRMSEARHELKVMHEPARTSQIPPAPFARYANGEFLAKE